MPATPEIPTQEKSSLRNTFSMSRWAIMFPAVDAPVARHEHAAVEVHGDDRGPVRQVPGGLPGRAARAGQQAGAATARKSAKDEVPTLRHAAVNCASQVVSAHEVPSG